MLTGLGGMSNITMPIFFQRWSIQRRDIAILSIFQMAAAAIFYF